MWRRVRGLAAYAARFGENALAARRDRMRAPEERTRRSRPMVWSLFLTTRCNLRCPYCDNGQRDLYPDLDEPARLDTTEVLRLLEIMRRVSPGIDVTGGEPTLRPDLGAILRHAVALAYFPIVLNTNALRLDRHLDVLESIDYLAVSLDALDPARADALAGAGAGVAARALANLELAVEHRRRRGRPEIVVNTVVLPETIEDAWDVWERCVARGLTWAPSPHLAGKHPNPGLVDHPGWTALVDEIARCRRRGGRVFGSPPALARMRDFAHFDCYPLVRPVVYPDGDLLYPCAHMRTRGGNVLEQGDYERALALGVEAHGPVPACQASCHVGCYLEVSSTLTAPAEALREGARMALPSTRAPPPRRPAPAVARPAPPSVADVKALPSLPADEVRSLRAAGRLRDDFSSRLRVVA